MKHLAAEGLAERSVLVGDVMTDLPASSRRRADRPPPRPKAIHPVITVATIHRAENTDDPEEDPGDRHTGCSAASRSPCAEADRPLREFDIELDP